MTRDHHPNSCCRWCWINGAAVQTGRQPHGDQPGHRRGGGDYALATSADVMPPSPPPAPPSPVSRAAPVERAGVKGQVAELMEAKRPPSSPRRWPSAAACAAGHRVRRPGQHRQRASSAGAARHLRARRLPSIADHTPVSGVRPSAWWPPSRRVELPAADGGGRSSSRWRRLRRRHQTCRDHPADHAHAGADRRRGGCRPACSTWSSSGSMSAPRWPGNRDVDVVTFTGPTAGPRRWMAAAAARPPHPTGTRKALPVAFDDADLTRPSRARSSAR